MNGHESLLISVVSYNSGHIIEQCLSHLLPLCEMDDLQVEVVLVDNASSDGTAEIAARFLSAQPKSRIRLIAGTSNVGWGAGNNLAIESAATRPDFVLLCNPDAWIDAANLRNLIAAIQSFTPRGAIAVPYLQSSSGGHVVLGASPEWGLRHYILDRIIGAKYPYESFQRRYCGRSEAFAVESGYASGAMALFSYPYLLRAGFFDERIFMYHDDIDITRSIVSVGGTLVGAGNAVAFHIGAEGSKIGPDHPRGTSSAALSAESELVFVEKWHGKRAAFALALYRWLVSYRLAALLQRAIGRHPDDTTELRAPSARYVRLRSAARVSRQAG